MSIHYWLTADFFFFLCVYSFVLAAATSTFFLNYVHMVLTVKARKQSNIAYPNAYASDELAKKDPAAFAFNCAQRAHANFSENQPSVLGALLIAGLRNPVPASILGATWAFGRLWYALGYTSSAGPKGRARGAVFSTTAQFALILMAGYTSVMFSLGQ
jgi:glutathione S-transferase